MALFQMALDPELLTILKAIRFDLSQFAEDDNVYPISTRPG
jgi:hypothetical protein